MSENITFPHTTYAGGKNAQKTDERVMETVMKNDSIMKPIIKMPKQVESMMEIALPMMNNGSYWQKVDDKFVQTNNFEEPKFEFMKMIHEG